MNLAKTSEVPLNVEGNILDLRNYLVILMKIVKLLMLIDIILKDLDFDISNYKMKNNEHSDKQEENIPSNIVPSKQDSILLNQVKSLKQHVNTLQFERDQLERKYKGKLEEDNEVS